jgi:hypothetical protein
MVSILTLGPPPAGLPLSRPDKAGPLMLRVLVRQGGRRHNRRMTQNGMSGGHALNLLLKVIRNYGNHAASQSGDEA